MQGGHVKIWYAVADESLRGLRAWTRTKLVENLSIFVKAFLWGAHHHKDLSNSFRGFSDFDQEVLISIPQSSWFGWDIFCF